MNEELRESFTNLANQSFSLTVAQVIFSVFAFSMIAGQVFEIAQAVQLDKQHIGSRIRSCFSK